MLCTLARTDTQPSACGEHSHATASCVLPYVSVHSLLLQVLCMVCRTDLGSSREKPTRPQKAILGPKWPSRDRGVWAVSCVMGPCLGPSHTFVRSVEKGCALREQRSVC